MRVLLLGGFTSDIISHCHVWDEFCDDIGIDPNFHAITDPVPYLQIYGARYRDGRIAPRRKPVKSGTVSDAILSISETFTRMGAKDPRFNAHGVLDARLSAQYTAYTKTDAPANRVKPLPVTVVVHALDFAFTARPTPERKAIAAMICIAFFFCL